jgi:hypothetical protein
LCVEVTVEHDWIHLAHGRRLEVPIGERRSPLDKAAMESWFAPLKNEETYPTDTGDQGRSAVPTVHLHLDLRHPAAALDARLPHPADYAIIKSVAVRGNPSDFRDLRSADEPQQPVA